MKSNKDRVLFYKSPIVIEWELFVLFSMIGYIFFLIFAYMNDNPDSIFDKYFLNYLFYYESITFFLLFLIRIRRYYIFNDRIEIRYLLIFLRKIIRKSDIKDIVLKSDPMRFSYIIRIHTMIRKFNILKHISDYMDCRFEIGNEKTIAKLFKDLDTYSVDLILYLPVESCERIFSKIGNKSIKRKYVGY